MTLKILVTNDDGIDAPGIEALARVAAEFGEVTVVAPDRAHSGCGHRVTTDEPIHMSEVGEHRWSINGTPADCARVGLWQILPDADWVLSGINSGANLGVDVFMSGTVAAIREAALHQKPGIALSHYRKSNGHFDWQRAMEFARRAIGNLIKQPLSIGEFWNVNLPDLTGLAEHQPDLVECPLNPLHLPIHFEPDVNGGLRYRGVYHNRPRTSGDDVDVCFSGHVAITRLSVWRP